jgi:nucleoside triphosphatase
VSAPLAGHRLVVVPVIRNASGDYLLCRMPIHRGVFPGQWGLPGGGVGPGETLEQALAREVREELGAELISARALHFSDLSHEKTFADGSRRSLYMVFLLYDCRIDTATPTVGEEIDEIAWVSPDRLVDYDLNSATREAFTRLGALAETAGERSDLAAIEHAVGRFRAAFAAGDPAALADCYSDDLIKMRQGFAAEDKSGAVARIAATLREARGDLEVRNDEIVISGDLAVVIGSFVVALTPKTGGDPRMLRRRFVEVWRREEVGWRVYRTLDNSDASGSARPER